MADKNLTSEKANDQRAKNLIRSRYKDIMVKVDDDIYYLDRLRLALKSRYFEKLFIEDYREKNCDSIELPLMDTDTFSAVVDIIYGEKLESVVNSENFVLLLMTMDYLQIDIDPEAYLFFAKEQLIREKNLNKDIFRLYQFIANNWDYDCLLPLVFEHMSTHIEKLQDRDEFLSIPFHHFVRIILKKTYRLNESKGNFSPFSILSEICAKWIFYNVQNRLSYTIDLVNAARRRLNIAGEIPRDDVGLQWPASDEKMNKDLISRKFYRLLAYFGEICCSNNGTSKYENDENKEKIRKDEYFLDDSSSDEITMMEEDSDNESLQDYPITTHIRPLPSSSKQYLFSQEQMKLQMFLENNNFYDITVKVGEKLYKLHRRVLESMSLYFAEIFSIEYWEIAAHCEEVPPTPPSKDKIYFINEIDSTSFDVIINYIYSGEIDYSCDDIFRLFKAVHILSIDSLKKSCYEWIKSDSEEIAVDIVEILNFTHAHAEYEDLNRFFLSKYIADSRCKVENLQQFADLFKTNEKMHSFDDEVDREIFKLIIGYVYLSTVKLNGSNILRILKVSEKFEIEKMMGKCAEWLVDNSKTLSSNDDIEVLSFARRNNTKYRVLYFEYLVKHVMKWPQIECSLFYPISFDCLRNMLSSPKLCFDDPRTILDICSKWVVHDTENRYRLLPQIAQAINQNYSVDCDDYPIEISFDSKQCSADFVKDKLWEILSSTCVLPTFTLLKCEDVRRKETEQPVFIMLKEHKLFYILNSHWDKIAAFRLCRNVPIESSFDHFSATMVNDNVFILSKTKMSSRADEIVFFHVYSLSSKKLFALSSDIRLRRSMKIGSLGYFNTDLKYTLLNCRDEIYCCFEDSKILKYSIELNRWMLVSDYEPHIQGIRFTSDGNKLYRMYVSEQTHTWTHYISEVYDFQQNSWKSTPNLSNLTRTHNSLVYDSGRMHGIVFMRNRGLVAWFRDELFLFNRDTQTWENTDSLPHWDNLTMGYYGAILAQNESDEMLYVMNNKLYRFSSSEEIWLCEKTWPWRKSEYDRNCKQLPYSNMITIHRPNIRT